MDPHNPANNTQAGNALPIPPPAPPPAAASWLPPSVPVQPSAAGSAAQGTPGNTSASTAPDSAADTDIIEKEWIVKTKEIIEATRHDPHRQTKELHKLKAEYMNKRYNRIIEPVEE